MKDEKTEFYFQLAHGGYPKMRLLVPVRGGFKFYVCYECSHKPLRLSCFNLYRPFKTRAQAIAAMRRYDDLCGYPRALKLGEF